MLKKEPAPTRSWEQKIQDLLGRSWTAMAEAVLASASTELTAHPLLVGLRPLDMCQWYIGALHGSDCVLLLLSEPSGPVVTFTVPASIYFAPRCALWSAHVCAYLFDAPAIAFLSPTEPQRKIQYSVTQVVRKSYCQRATVKSYSTQQLISARTT